VLIDNDARAFTMIHDFGLVVPEVKGEKLINKYPVDSRDFYNMKLNIKFDGDDYVLGDTITGCDGTILYICENSKINAKVRIINDLDFLLIKIPLKGFKGVICLLCIILLSKFTSLN